jgi:hypothetical protein
MSCPSTYAPPEGRRDFFRQAKRERESANEDAGSTEPEPDVPLELDAKDIVGRGRQGRDAWLREGKRQLEQQRWEKADAILRSRRSLVDGGGQVGVRPRRRAPRQRGI